jgi:hypothetical protein
MAEEITLEVSYSGDHDVSLDEQIRGIVGAHEDDAGYGGRQRDMSFTFPTIAAAAQAAEKVAKLDDVVFVRYSATVLDRGYIAK